MDPLTILIPLFFLTALVYASAGFAGGSTYLALLALFLPYQSIPKISLALNIVVVTGSLYHYLRQKQLCFKSALPLVCASVPMAFVGGSLHISKTVFFILLGFSLAIAGLRLLLTERRYQASTPVPLTWSKGLLCGAIIGFFSGLVGIGGGIFLSPLLYFLRWGNPRQIAAQATFFIFVNSLSGLLGQFSKGTAGIDPAFLFPLAMAVLMGGQAGVLLNLKKLNLSVLQRITALLVLFVTAQIFWRIFSA